MKFVLTVDYWWHGQNHALTVVYNGVNRLVPDNRQVLLQVAFSLELGNAMFALNNYTTKTTIAAHYIFKNERTNYLGMPFKKSIELKKQANTVKKDLDKAKQKNMCVSGYRPSLSLGHRPWFFYCRLCFLQLILLAEKCFQIRIYFCCNLC